MCEYSSVCNDTQGPPKAVHTLLPFKASCIQYFLKGSHLQFEVMLILLMQFLLLQILENISLQDYTIRSFENVRPVLWSLQIDNLAHPLEA